MTSLDRAKQFLANKARKLALAAVPLAALTVAAPQADATLLFSGTDCDVSGSGSPIPGSSCSVEILSDRGNGANGIKVSGQADWGMDPGPQSQSRTGYISWFGAVDSGSFSGTLPVYWDFDTTFIPSFSGSLTWDLQVFLNSNPVAFASGSHPGPHLGSGSALISGSGFTSWEIRLTLNAFSATSGGMFGVTVPGNSIDLNPDAADVPEPASILLFAPGLGYLLWRRRRRQ